jgi:hypothetical protein
MSKEIKMNPEFLGVKRAKTQKKPSGSELKKALLQSLSSPGILESFETDKPTETKLESKPEIKPEIKPTTYGCLKNGSLPTLRQLKRSATTVKQYASFGKMNKGGTVRVLIKDRETYAKIERDIKKIDKRSMTEIRDYLRKRRLYKIGSTAPDDVLRDIYKNAILTGNVENNSSDTLMHNFLNEV